MITTKDSTDKYATPSHVWKNILKYLPKDKVIWEPFNDGSEISMQSAKDMKKLGLKVISNPYNEETKENDFFTSNHGDYVLSNPPYSIKKQVMFRLFELDKPFILIVPNSTINRVYFKNFRPDTQVIIPDKRISFVNFKHNHKKNKKNNCCFDCLYVCWKMKLDKDLIFLD